MTWEEKCMDVLEKEERILGFSFDLQEREQMVRFGSLLVEWNQKMNLTGITDPAEVAIKHMLDSAVGARLLPPAGRVIDVGTGAGFPGVVLKIVRPDVDLVLLDSLKKRLTFLDEVISELGLTKVTTLHGRAEDAAYEKSLRESFDVSVSRAVAALPLLSEWCLPFVRVGGSFLAWKGPKGCSGQAFL